MTGSGCTAASLGGVATVAVCVAALLFQRAATGELAMQCVCVVHNVCLLLLRMFADSLHA